MPALQHAAPVGIEADVLPVERWCGGEQRVVPFPRGRHRSPAEVEGPPSPCHRLRAFLPGGEHRLDCRGIVEVVAGSQGGDERGHLGGGAGSEQIDGGVDGRSCQFRFVPLHVDDDVGVGKVRQGLHDTGGAAGSRRRGHHGPAPKGSHGGSYLGAVGGHHHSRSMRRPRGGSPGVFDERAAGLRQKHLAGQSLAGQSRGDDDQSLGRLGRRGWHGEDLWGRRNGENPIHIRA